MNKATRVFLRCTTVALAALIAASCNGGSRTTAAPARELINPQPSLAGASRYGDLVFTAGQLPEYGAQSGAGIKAQVVEALDNLERTLKDSGAGLDTLLKVNVYLKDWNDWDAFDTIYVQRVGRYGTPPRTTVQVSHLGWNSLIEIAAIAYVRSS
jgi:2-iminobutanoate/2-iminopropanoate deaminase